MNEFLSLARLFEGDLERQRWDMRNLPTCHKFLERITRGNRKTIDTGVVGNTKPLTSPRNAEELLLTQGGL